MSENLGVLSCLSMTPRRIWSTSSRISGSSVREKESSGSRKELGSAVSMLVRLTDGPDDRLLQLPLLVSFDDLCADVGAAVIGAGQLVVHAQTELPQQGVEHLQHGGACSQRVTEELLDHQAARPSSSLKQRSVSSTGLSFSFSDACSGEGERLVGSDADLGIDVKVMYVYVECCQERKVEQQRGDDLVHVLRVPDVGLQLIIHRLPHHTLQAFDTRHADPGRHAAWEQHPLCLLRHNAPTNAPSSGLRSRWATFLQSRACWYVISDLHLRRGRFPPVILDACHKAAVLVQVHRGRKMGGTSAPRRVSPGGSENQENRWIVSGLWKLLLPPDLRTTEEVS
ncbi:hypothetical protein EYF80_021166 [Liparis tanakae]|uniref:Uncharacterized protein n=1 Tax=Liparis tanakae TaxID=230148 RepID=A0A4Z2HUR2_9TELE|nr:hypothetical protein EYF80_021166 [Liparis tanakae]